MEHNSNIYNHPFKIRHYTLILIILFAGFLQNIFATTSGSQIIGVQNDIEKANQSQVFYYAETWWGIFKKANNNWAVAEYGSGSWSSNVETGINGVSSADCYVNESTGKLYVMVSKGSSKFTRLSYSGGNWTEDSGFPVAIDLESINGNDPACLTQASDGELFIFYVSGGIVKTLYSTDDGATWSRATITNLGDNASLTDAIGFDYAGQGQIGLFIGDGSSGGFKFYRLPNSDSPATPGNWISETLPTTGTGNYNNADDHVSIIRDSSHNLYMIGKNKKSPAPSFYLYKRNTNATWEQYSVEGSGATRPALTINSDTHTLILGATNNGHIEYVLLDKDNLSPVGTGDWTPILQDGSKVFNNVTLSYQILSNTSDVLFAAENTSDGNLWYNFLYNPDTPLPVELSSFNASPGFLGITLNWTTASELNNAFFVIEKSVDNHHYDLLSKVRGQGNSSGSSEYTYLDTDITAGQTYFYRLSEQSIDGKISILKTLEVAQSVLPQTTTLSQNYPNPFNPRTAIDYSLPNRSPVSLTIFNAAGKIVRVLVRQVQNKGSYSIIFNADGLSSGLYFYRLEVGDGFVETKRLILLK